MLNGKWAVFGAAALSLALSSALSAATPPPTASDVYEANYFLGLHQPSYPGCDANITILDPGTNGTGNMCADIYILNPSEELEACCGCLLTPDEILSGSVVQNLLSNNVSPIWLANGVIKIISSTPKNGKCNPAAPVPTPTMRAWLTRTDTTGSGQHGVTTTAFAQADLGSAEDASLAIRCGDILTVGSGFGSCYCPTEPPNNGGGSY